MRFRLRPRRTHRLEVDRLVGWVKRRFAAPTHHLAIVVGRRGEAPLDPPYKWDESRWAMDAVIDVVGADELPAIVDIYNQIFRPQRDIDAFQRRYLGRYNVLQMLATVNQKPVGFFLGFELKPTTYFAWFYGVLPEHRRTGVATQLMEAAHEWTRNHGYEVMRVECHNHHRPLLHLSIALGYDIVGIRWDSDRGDNLVIFEKNLTN